MAAIAFDPLEYTHELEATGVPRAQAEVHAKAMTARFLHNVDALVTRDYLDTRFSKFTTRLEAKMDQRFAEVDRRFVDVDRRFAQVDTRFAEIDKRFVDIDRRFASIDIRFERIDGQFGKVYLMLGIIMATTALPALQRLADWLG